MGEAKRRKQLDSDYGTPQKVVNTLVSAGSKGEGGVSFPEHQRQSVYQALKMINDQKLLPGMRLDAFFIPSNVLGTVPSQSVIAVMIIDASADLE